MMYLVTTGTERKSADGKWTGQIQSPTFILDSHIQGIMSAKGAEKIVRHWLVAMGLTVDFVTVSVYHVRDSQAAVDEFYAADEFYEDGA